MQADGVAQAGMRLLGNEILLVPFKADFRTASASNRLLGSCGENAVLLSQLVFSFNVFLSKDSIEGRYVSEESIYIPHMPQGPLVHNL